MGIDRVKKWAHHHVIQCVRRIVVEALRLCRDRVRDQILEISIKNVSVFFRGRRKIQIPTDDPKWFAASDRFVRRELGAFFPDLVISFCPEIVRRYDPREYRVQLFQASRRRV